MKVCISVAVVLCLAHSSLSEPLCAFSAITTLVPDQIDAVAVFPSVPNHCGTRAIYLVKTPAPGKLYLGFASQNRSVPLVLDPHPAAGELQVNQPDNAFVQGQGAGSSSYIQFRRNHPVFPLRRHTLLAASEADTSTQRIEVNTEVSRLMSPSRFLGLFEATAIATSDSGAKLSEIAISYVSEHALKGVAREHVVTARRIASSVVTIGSRGVIWSRSGDFEFRKWSGEAVPIVSPATLGTRIEVGNSRFSIEDIDPTDAGAIDEAHALLCVKLAHPEDPVSGGRLESIALVQDPVIYLGNP